MGSQNKKLIQESCWAIANIVSCGASIISLCFEQGIFTHAQFLLKFKDLDILREAMWIICNGLLLSNADQLIRFIEVGVIENLCELFAINDIKIQIGLLKVFKNLMYNIRKNESDELYNKIKEKFEKCGGVDSLERLQMSENTEINEHSTAIMKEHYMTEDIKNSLLFDPPMLI